MSAQPAANRLYLTRGSLRAGIPGAYGAVHLRIVLFSFDCRDTLAHVLSFVLDLGLRLIWLIMLAVIVLARL